MRIPKVWFAALCFLECVHFPIYSTQFFEELKPFQNTSLLYQGFAAFNVICSDWFEQVQPVFEKLGIDISSKQGSKEAYAALKALLNFSEKNGKVHFSGLIPAYGWTTEQLVPLLDKAIKERTMYVVAFLLALKVPLSQNMKMQLRRSKKAIAKKILSVQQNKIEYQTQSSFFDDDLSEINQSPVGAGYAQRQQVDQDQDDDYGYDSYPEVEPIRRW